RPNSSSKLISKLRICTESMPRSSIRLSSAMPRVLAASASVACSPLATEASTMRITRSCKFSGFATTAVPPEGQVGSVKNSHIEPLQHLLVPDIAEQVAGHVAVPELTLLGERVMLIGLLHEAFADKLLHSLAIGFGYPEIAARKHQLGQQHVAHEVEQHSL